MAHRTIVAFLFTALAQQAALAGATAANGLAVRATPADHVTITEFRDLPGGNRPLYFPTGIAPGPNGALWVTDDIDQDFGQDAVARITTAGKRTTTFHYQAEASPSFEDIVAGPDGALWIADDGDTQIVRVTISGEFSTFTTRPYVPSAIAAGPDGALWFTLTGFSNSAIGRLTTTGKMTIYSNGITGNWTQDITAGSDGALWFTEPTNNRIGRITTHGSVTEYSMGIPSGSEPYAIAAGPDGALWFTEMVARRVARITTAGVVTMQSRVLSANPIDITGGPDKALWFTEMKSRLARIGRITTAGSTTEYTGLTQGSDPTAITAGPDGNVWFVETNANRVGRVNL
ncbi:MAG: Virginiamycin B lyase [Candidatus Eremiobacteraeota bacterium]|nr:Virginiamycin B lyase [Candidatus Eremiobacteraeota bacterium]